MKHPFWIVNSTLLLLFIFVLGFVYFSRVSLPRREYIEPEPYFKPTEKMVQVNIKKIYENDLFGTYSKEFPTPGQPDFSVPFPEPPRDAIVPIPAAPKPQFLDPLPISLKGIIIIRSDHTKNRAILEDNKTKQEATYKVGDSIEDAQLIRIFSNKIIFLRSNGQQEVLYLREQDAKDDPMYAIIEGWEEVIRPLDATRFIVNKDTFAKRVPNLAQFIDMLRLTTAYQKGESVGTRIGQLDKNGLGTYLGLQTGDIITSINGIPTGSSEQRLTIYKSIIKNETGRHHTSNTNTNRQQYSVAIYFERI